MRLDLFRIEVLHLQNMHLAFGSFQDPLAVQHALLKVGRLLEQLVLGGDFSQLPLKWREEQKEVCKINPEAHPEPPLKHEEVVPKSLS